MCVLVFFEIESKPLGIKNWGGDFSPKNRIKDVFVWLIQNTDGWKIFLKETPNFSKKIH